MDSLHLFNVPLLHKTYHHFVGEGLFDSNLDVILHPKNPPNYEAVLNIICKFHDWLVDSHHDIILTTMSLPTSVEEHIDVNLVQAPRIDNNRVQIIWADDKIEEYKMEIADRLTSLRQRWFQTPSKTSVSILLEMNNIVLTDAAKSCFKFIKLGDKKPDIKPKLPRELLEAQTTLRIAQKFRRKQTRLEGGTSIRPKLEVNEARRRYKL